MSQDELERAGELQRALLPAAGVHEVPGFGIYAASQAVSACSGDWWSIDPVGDGASLLALGDVTGHGAAAAMLAALSLGALHAALLGLGDAMQPDVGLTVLNEVVAVRAQGRRLVTALAMRLHADGVIVLGNAGHPPPWRLRAGVVDVVTSSGQPPLGAYAGQAYGNTEIALGPGEILLCFTDGVIECPSPSGQQFSERALRDVCTQVMAAGGDSQRLVESVMAALDAHRGPRSLADDVTVVALQRRA